MQKKDTAIPAPSSAKPILIVLVAGIGDMVLASKAIRTIRRGHPDSEIHMLTSTDAAPLAENYPCLDKVCIFPIRELRTDKGALLDMAKVVRTLRGKTFAVIMNLYRISSFAGAVKMGCLFSMLRADKKIGHDRYGFGLFLTSAVPASTFGERHIADAMQEIALKAGGIPDNGGIEVFWRPESETPWRSFFSALAGKLLVGINPGGDRTNRRWDPLRFAVVARRLIERFNAHIIVLGGPAERDIASLIESGIEDEISNLSGTVPLNELPYVISRLNLLLTNDSGPMHIAGATKTPLVALFGPEDPLLFGPYTSPELFRIIRKELPCSPCGDKKCPIPSCLDSIMVEEVLAACEELLGTIGVHQS